MSTANEPQWEMLTEVYHPDEAQMIHGLLNMAGIPVKIDRDSAGDLFGLTIGPLAKITILVPREKMEEAFKIISGNYEGLEGLDEENL